MAILEILHYPDNRLRQKCVNIEVFDKSLEQIVENMLETMYDAKGIGLAAIQVNICLLYTSPSPRDGLLSRMPSSA